MSNILFRIIELFIQKIVFSISKKCLSQIQVVKNIDELPFKIIKKPLSVFFILLMILVFLLGFIWSEYINNEIRFAYLGLQLEKWQLLDKNEKLSLKSSVLEQTNLIDSEVNKQIKIKLSQLISSRLELEKKVSFYKSVLSPESIQKGLYLHTLELVRNPKIRGDYTFKLVLSQASKYHSALVGIASVTIQGQELGKSKNYSLFQLSGYKKEIPFQFHYFQALPESRKKMSFSLPKNFVPKFLTVNLRSKTMQVKSYHKKIKWSNIIMLRANGS